MPKGELTITLNEKDYQSMMRKLNALSNVDKRTAIANSLKRGMRIIQAAGKVNLKQRDLHTSKKGNLKKSFAIKLNRKKKVIYAGFKHPGGNHSFLVDVGTRKRYTRRGYFRGSVQKGGERTGNRFWHDAVEDNGGKATQALIDTVYDEVTKLMNRN